MDTDITRVSLETLTTVILELEAIRDSMTILIDREHLFEDDRKDVGQARTYVNSAIGRLSGYLDFRVGSEYLQRARDGRK